MRDRRGRTRPGAAPEGAPVGARSGSNSVQRLPWGKPWDRQPVSGKLRRKLGVSPGFAAYHGPPPPKRLSTKVRYNSTMGTHGMKTLVIYSLCLAMAAPAMWSADTAALRGYSSAAARAEREWEGKFRAIPDAAALRAYMQRLSARPHHVGSAYDKGNAEWIAAKAKEWGLDAQIETFDVLFPTPKERLLEMIEPRRVEHTSEL